MTRRPASTALRVGVFLAVALALAALAIFAVGEKSGLFERDTTLYTYFDDISGLVEGASVRLAGLDVGVVSGVEFPASLQKRQARVALSIKSRYMERVRTDSVAQIDSKGLLGDKIINITLGTSQKPRLGPGEVLPSRHLPTLEDLTLKLDRSVSSITAEAELLLTGTRALFTQLTSTTARVDRILAAVEHGDGFAHELIHGQSGKLLVADLRSLVAQTDAVVREVRDGDGLLHALVYEPENARALTELNQASARLNRVLGEVEKGRGTLGGLIMDPSIYEDVRTILGNVERNVLLKALIRFTVKKGDIERPATLNAKPVEP